jgi:site-specific DNA-cytosine methylase
MRDDENTNTITGVQKDNLVVAPELYLSEPSHKHGEERTYTDIAPTIQSRYGTGGDNIPYVHDNRQVDLQLRDGRDNRSTLRSGRATELRFKGHSIRRLTEIECERLQGFEDNWTEFGNYDGVIKKIPKTQRYKLMGNAVTVDIVALVASRININTEAPNR